jgi:hypothetical protein
MKKWRHAAEPKAAGDGSAAVQMISTPRSSSIFLKSNGTCQKAESLK